jgi:hypothetical protein
VTAPAPAPPLLETDLRDARAWLASAPALRPEACAGYLARLQARLAGIAAALLAVEPEAGPEALSAYPELARLLAQATARWRSLGERLLADHARDGWALTGSRDARIDACTASGSALRVVIGDRAVYYKRLTRPIAPWLQALVAALPLAAPLHRRRILVGDGCVWDDEVVPAPCATDAEVERFYWRAGAWLGVCGTLGITDLHARNVCAHGEHPVPLDVETLAERPIGPVQVGLLPLWSEAPPGVIWPQVGGLHPGGVVVLEGARHEVAPTWPELGGRRVAPRYPKAA